MHSSSIVMFLLILLQVTITLGNSCSVCPFKDKDSCQKWDAEIKAAKLQTNQEWILKEIGMLKDKIHQKEAKITNLQNEVKQKDIEMKQKVGQLETNLKQKDEEIERRLNERLSHHWQLKRIDMTLPKMTKLRLHHKSPTISESFPLPLPMRTCTILIQLYIHQIVVDHDGVLIGTIGQRGNANGATAFHHHHALKWNNAWAVEMMVPWNTDGQNMIDLRVDQSYNNHANIWFTFKVSGYITA